MKRKYHQHCLDRQEWDSKTLSDAKDSMRKYGFQKQYPVMTFRGEIIDGRHRLQVADELIAEGVKVSVVMQEWVPPASAKTEEAIQEALRDYCIMANDLRRHHVTDLQRASILIQKKKLAENPDLNISEAARNAGIPRTAMSKAVAIARVSPRLSADVATGKTDGFTAYKSIPRASKILPVPAVSASQADPERDDFLARKAPAASQESIVLDFKRLAEMVSELSTKLGRMKLCAMGLEKRIGNGVALIRIIDAYAADLERLNKALIEWSKRSSVK